MSRKRSLPPAEAGDTKPDAAPSTDGVLDELERITGFVARAPVVSQQRRESERAFQRMRNSANAKKRQEALVRGAQPRTKQTKVAHHAMARQAAMVQNFRLPDVGAAHRCMLERFDMAEHDKPSSCDDDAAARREAYMANYAAWGSFREHALGVAAEAGRVEAQAAEKRRAEAQVQAYRRAHARALCPSLVLVATQVPHGSGAKIRADAPRAATLTGYFAPCPEARRDTVATTYTRFYHDNVVGATARVGGWPMLGTSECDAFSDDHDAGPDGGNGTGMAVCSECGTALMVDAAMGAMVCGGCGISQQGGAGVGLKQTFAESQASSRPAAPYERLAHVSGGEQDGGVSGGARSPHQGRSRMAVPWAPWVRWAPWAPWVPWVSRAPRARGARGDPRHTRRYSRGCMRPIAPAGPRPRASRHPHRQGGPGSALEGSAPSFRTRDADISLTLLFRPLSSRSSSRASRRPSAPRSPRS
jgi:hypothetical protein